MYRKALSDIELKIRMLQSDELTQSRIYQIQYQQALKGQIEGILEKLHGDEYSTIQKYLSDTYTDAYVGTMYAMHGQGVPVIIPIDRAAAVKAVVTDSKLSVPLYASLGYDMDKLKKHIREEITRGIASSLPYEQIARNLAGFTDIPLNRAKTIVRTEGHRIQQSSTDDARKKAKKAGADVVKQWDASLDGATRPIHRRLDGQIREIDEPFEAGGKKAMYPGKFNDPAQDCNCRCVALTRARSALDEKELETLKERAKYFGLDKTEDFEEFKQKYLKAAEHEVAYVPRKTGAMRRDPANFRKAQGAQPAASAPEPGEFKKAATIEQAIQTAKSLTKNDKFEVNGLHLNTVNAFNEAMHNVFQRFGRKLNINGLAPVKSTDAQYMAGAYNATTRIVSLKGGNSANAMSNYAAHAEKYFRNGWNASNDPYATLYHEIGHAIWTDLPASARNEITTLYKDTKHAAFEKWRAMGGSSSGKSQAEVFGKELSRYAHTEDQEFFSEAFAQIMAGRMKPVSRKVNAVLQEQYKAKK